MIQTRGASYARAVLSFKSISSAVCSSSFLSGVVTVTHSLPLSRPTSHCTVTVLTPFTPVAIDICGFEKKMLAWNIHSLFHVFSYKTFKLLPQSPVVQSIWSIFPVLGQFAPPLLGGVQLRCLDIFPGLPPHTPLQVLQSPQAPHA